MLMEGNQPIAPGLDRNGIRVPERCHNDRLVSGWVKEIIFLLSFFILFWVITSTIGFRVVVLFVVHICWLSIFSFGALTELPKDVVWVNQKSQLWEKNLG